MRRMDIESGTFFTDLDENSHSRVAVLGSDVKKKLFSGQNALGEKVRLNGDAIEGGPLTFTTTREQVNPQRTIKTTATITLDGKPIEQGNINFFPIRRTAGPVVGTDYHIAVLEHTGYLPCTLRRWTTTARREARSGREMSRFRRVWSASPATQAVL